MKYLIFQALAIAGLLSFCYSCRNEVADIDGNVYHTVKIGKQVWMVENLKTTRYRNGDLIPIVADSLGWYSLSKGAYCNYENNADSFSLVYGRLYNWFAISDNRNIAPDGWHVATDADWKLLVTYLGGENVAGKKLKEVGMDHWQSLNTKATNETGFSALPGGARFVGKNFNCIGLVGFWWSSSEANMENAWVWRIGNDDDLTYSRDDNKRTGYSVRCVLD
ncbi:MAG: fibrobacter succinogenes major paralogous domain-containing protein [Bacteroidales bacterium]